MTIDHTCVVLATPDLLPWQRAWAACFCDPRDWGIVWVCILMFNVRCISLPAPLTVFPPFLFVCLFPPGPVKWCTARTVTGSRALLTYLDLGASRGLLLLHQIFYWFVYDKVVPICCICLLYFANSGVVFRSFVIVFCFVEGSRIWQLNCCVNNFILLYYLLNYINVGAYSWHLVIMELYKVLLTLPSLQQNSKFVLLPAPLGPIIKLHCDVRSKTNLLVWTAGRRAGTSHPAAL